jgi:hypothetical protein
MNSKTFINLGYRNATIFFEGVKCIDDIDVTFKA